jgi:oxygen-independent coproporphyrinogen-3 oxidase
LEFYGNLLKDKQIKTIYFGGGTPSLMSFKLIEIIFTTIHKICSVSKNCEITLETNPNSIDLSRLQFYKKMGINRISLGVQSLNDDVLRFLGRIHNKKQILENVNNIQNLFDNYSIDLIYSYQGQTLKGWETELKEAIKISPYHLSAYQLIIESGTYFKRHKIKTLDDDLSIELYNFTNDFLSDNGIDFYEISNYARNGYESKHNLVYWDSGEWVGIGAGAHGRFHLNDKRYAIQNNKDPLIWCKKVKQNGNGVSIKKKLTDEEIREEKILMGLRTIFGIKDYRKLKLKNLEILQKEGLILLDKNNLKLSRKGFLVLNSIVNTVI